MPSRQKKFFTRNGSGCSFAAKAARDMSKYGWKQVACNSDIEEIDKKINEAIADPDVSTLSLIFTDVCDQAGLLKLLVVLQNCDAIYLEKRFDSGSNYGFRFRAKVEDLVSWVTGFGPFDFFPVTRRAPLTELTIRVKPRPHYDWSFKKAPEGVIHLADMDMKGMPDKNLVKLWAVSFQRTEKLLGHKPNQESAAKTTFVVPKNFID